MKIDDENPWDRILTSNMFALSATVHTAIKCTQAQLMFLWDSILHTCHKSNWELSKKRKQVMKKGSKEKNCNKKYTPMSESSN